MEWDIKLSRTTKVNTRLQRHSMFTMGQLQAMLPDPGYLFTLPYSWRYSVGNLKKRCPIYTKSLANLAYYQ